MARAGEIDFYDSRSCVGRSAGAGDCAVAVLVIRRFSVLLLMSASVVVGCRLPGREGPVSQSLAECRRLSRQGVAAFERGRQQEAEQLLAQAVAACPADAEARRHYAEVLWRRGARLEAIAQMEEAGRLAGEDAGMVARLAEMHLAAGQLDQARRHAQRALDLDAKLPAAWLAHGRVSRAAGQPHDALADYQRALGQAPRDRAILREVAELYCQLNQHDRALQVLQSLADTYALGDEPDDVLDFTGQVYVALGRYDDAVDSFSAAVARGAPTADRYCRLGEANLLAGHPREAASAATQALVLDPQHVGCRALVKRIELAERAGTVRR